MMRILYIAFVVAFVSVKFSKAQDTQFSMYDASEVVLNPALAGTDKESKLRAVSQYRTQYSSLGNNYITTSISVDKPIIDERWGAGVYLFHNDASNIFKETSFIVSGSYDVLDPGQDVHHLTTGINIGFINKHLSSDEFTFDSQYENGDFNESLPSGETIARNNRFMPEVAFGVAYINTDKNQVYRPYGGFALNHITKPNESFVTDASDNARIPIRWMLNGGCKLFFQNEEIEIDPKFMVMKQSSAWNILLGVTGGYKINSDVKINGGFQYRFNDAIIPQLGVDYMNFTYAISYDITVSELNEFNNKRGALELMVAFRGISNFGMGSAGVPHAQ